MYPSTEVVIPATIVLIAASFRLSVVRRSVFALADLTADEATTEKVVHQLVVHDGAMASGTAEQRAA